LFSLRPPDRVLEFLESVYPTVADNSASYIPCGYPSPRRFERILSTTQRNTHSVNAARQVGSNDTSHCGISEVTIPEQPIDFSP
jgi:hypothetical protein